MGDLGNARRLACFNGGAMATQRRRFGSRPSKTPHAGFLYSGVSREWTITIVTRSQYPQPKMLATQKNDFTKRTR